MRFTASVLLVSAVLALVPACATDAQHAGDGRAVADVVLTEEISRRVEEIQFMRGAELVTNLERLAHIGEPAVPRLTEAAGSSDDKTRSSVAYVFGIMRDRRNIPTLVPLLSDPVPGVRFQAASSLVELGDSRGFPGLVEGLASNDVMHRYKCIEVLRDATQRDFGYEHDSGPDSRRLAVRRWLDWLDDVQAAGL